MHAGLLKFICIMQMVSSRHERQRSGVLFIKTLFSITKSVSCSTRSLQLNVLLDGILYIRCGRCHFLNKIRWVRMDIKRLWPPIYNTSIKLGHMIYEPIESKYVTRKSEGCWIQVGAIWLGERKQNTRSWAIPHATILIPGLLSKDNLGEGCTKGLKNTYFKKGRQFSYRDRAQWGLILYAMGHA